VEWRLKAIEAVAKHVPTRYYGRCNNNAQAPNNNKQEALKECMLYMSFENDKVYDYVTEKFYEAWYMDPPSLMIYYGAPNIDDYKPSPLSFIDARSYPSMDELGLYLKGLVSNQTEYMKYFEWRKTGIPEKDMSHTLLQHTNGIGWKLPCKLCVATIQMQEARKVLAHYGIVPEENKYTVNREHFEEKVKNLENAGDLEKLYDLAYSRYWKGDNLNSEWNTRDYRKKG
jgi:hypothetical protein